ncbi:MAG: hypothetical protein ABL867_11360 [Rickettsiales bacterium]
MSAELHIPIHNEQVLKFWQSRAQKSGLSLEEEISELLSKFASRSHVEEKFSALRKEVKIECGTLPDSTLMIREDRDN